VKLLFFKLLYAIKLRFSRTTKAFNIQDLLFIIGYLLFGYGLFIIYPALCFTICGGLLMFLCLFTKGDG